MGLCCSRRNVDNSLQHELNETINNDELVQNDQEIKHEEIGDITTDAVDDNNNESSLNTMSVTISAVAEHPIQNDDDDDDDDDDEEEEEDIHNDNDNKYDEYTEENINSRYKRLLNRMHKRKNLKSYLTVVKKSKTKQCISKRKKLKELLLDKSDEKEYKTAFDKTISPNAPKFEKLSYKTVFPEISFTEWIIKQGIILNEIINDAIHIYNSNIDSIPQEISTIIHCYTCDLLPGVYEFMGTMDYNGTESTDDESNDYNDYGNSNYCTCQIVLSSRSEIIGGYFSENSFKYAITSGSYTYAHPLCIEFTKEYFNYNYKYKVYGHINQQLQFKGYWKLLDGSRGGNIKMDCVEKTKQINQKNNQNKLNAGTYDFYGHCEYLPNKIKRQFFDDKQWIKCYLILNEKDFRITGVIKLLKNKNNEFSICDDDYHKQNIFVIDDMESEWDIYGGLHIQLMNGYIMEGFFNGYDFMGVWKDEQFKRFGHFQYEIFTASAVDKQYHNHENEYVFTKHKSLDSDEEEDI